MTTQELLKLALIGKKLKHRNQHGRDVILEVENVENITKSGSVDLEPATQANDWWPPSRDWSESYIEVTFVDGSKVKFDNGTNFEIIQ